MPAGRADVAAALAPVALALLELEAERVEVVDPDRHVAARRDDGVVGQQQVDLRGAGREPDRAVAQRGRWRDLGEAELRPEGPVGVGVGREGLQGDVVDQVRASR